MKLSSMEFRHWERKAITLLGMSGVGKTHLARILRRHHWFHYSGDYRIGTRHLDEAILDNIKQQAMQIPFLRELLRSDSIHIENNITFENLKPLSTFLGKVGNPDSGGIGLREFKRRQELHRQAEVHAMREVPEFIHKAKEIYGYDHFVNDAGGSLCELDDDGVIEELAGHTLILYLRASRDNEREIIERAERDPKPLYYPERFLDDQLQAYMEERGLDYAALIDPDDFVRWVFPKLLASRLPRYQAIADRYGYTISTDRLVSVTDEAGFLAIVEETLEQQQR
jgi:hypothetical protein